MVVESSLHVIELKTSTGLWKHTLFLKDVETLSFAAAGLAEVLSESGADQLTDPIVKSILGLISCKMAVVICTKERLLFRKELYI